MNKFGGVSFLVNAFHQIRNPNLELWLCGKGTNVDIDRIATIDPRVKRFGYVTEKHLQQLSRDATLFVNPRPASVPGNEKNFPSKVLEYLSYGKPVVSTWTEGLAPDYREVLIVLAEETEACLVHTLEDVLGWEQPRRLDMAAQIKNFLETRKLWNIQANRLFVWLRQYVLPKDYIL